MAEGDTGDHAGPAVGAEAGHDIHSAVPPQPDKIASRPTELDDGDPSAIDGAAEVPESIPGVAAAAA